ncbi:uncharacterized protein TNCV_164821 [Trichonephila clavipes]|nr:uncharacterized protein TNCV_164821 [Trichonephila clavipes]
MYRVRLGSVNVVIITDYELMKEAFAKDAFMGRPPNFPIELSEDTTTTRGLLATDHVILNHGQVTWTTPELAPPLLTTTPHQREDVSALDRFNVHRCPTRRVFSGTGIELVTSRELKRPPVGVVW